MKETVGPCFIDDTVYSTRRNEIDRRITGRSVPESVEKQYRKRIGSIMEEEVRICELRIRGMASKQYSRRNNSNPWQSRFVPHDRDYWSRYSS